MGEVHSGPPAELIARLRSVLPLRYFVETGTYQGHTALWARGHFDRVWTIEASRELHEAVIARYPLTDGLSFLFGDSKVILPRVVSEVEEPAIFWLDAHYSGENTYGVRVECPLLEEIRIVNRSCFDNVLIIDDARMFLAPPHPLHRADDWPDISCVLTALNEVGHRYLVILEDVIIAVPDKLKPSVVAYCQDAIVRSGKWGVNVANAIH